MYKASVAKRERLGLAAVKADLLENNLRLDTLPHADAVKTVIKINGSTSTEKPSMSKASDAPSSTIVEGKEVRAGGGGSAGTAACARLFAHRRRPAPPPLPGEVWGGDWLL